MRCIICKNHVHLILGDESVENLPRSAFSWPLFSQEEIEMLYRTKLDNPERTNNEKEVMTARLGRVIAEVKKQTRNRQGKFAGSFLPKSTQFHIANIDMGTRPGFWFDFVEEKIDICLILHNSPLGPLLGALHDCSLISYDSMPTRNLSRKGDIGGKCTFSVSSTLTVVK